MSTFYLTVNGGIDLLMMDGTNIWAFQTGSVEGPPGTYTITPSFDTTLFDLPSDIDVYYSLTGGATWVAAGYDPITNPTFDVTASAGTTLLAQLRYTADGSAVQRLNLSNILEDVPTVSLVLGVAPTFDGTPSASATDPTVGDSVSVLTYAASGTPAPTVTFEWFVDAVSQAETTDTFDTTGLSGGETLTCTVTASNGVSPDATANVNFGTVAAAYGTLIMSHATNGGTGSGGVERIYSTTPALTGGVRVEIRDTTKDNILSGGGLGPFIVFNNSTNGGAFISSFGLVNNTTTARVTVVETGDLGTNIYTADGTFSVWANGSTAPDSEAQYRLSGVTYSGQFASELGYDVNTVSAEVYFKVL